MITVSIASLRDQEHMLHGVVAQLVDQTDNLNVYLDGYDHVPGWLDEMAESNLFWRMRIRLSKEDGLSLHGAGKFAFVNDADPDQPYLTVDDDLNIPPNYVEEILGFSQIFPRSVVGYHGIRLRPPIKKYFKDREVMTYCGGLDKLIQVDCLGTGVMAFYPHTIKITPDLFPPDNPQCLDILVGRAAKNLGVPMLCLPRRQSWITERPWSGWSMEPRYKDDDGRQTALASETWREPR